MNSFICRFLMSTALALVGVGAASVTVSAGGIRGPSRSLDHVFLIVMENETDTDIIGNPNAPFINSFSRIANWGSNYFAVGHPSAPNYLEIVGGSNFGLKGDNWPNWTVGGCVDDQPNSTGCNGAFAPISVAGTDNGVVATATKQGDCNGAVAIVTNSTPNNCALRDYKAAPFTPTSIADQLVASGLSWKTYQESLPKNGVSGVGVNYADGTFSNLSDASVFGPGPIQKLYAVKHNPFAYFKNIQIGANPALSVQRMANFEGPMGLWADLQNPAQMPNFALIAPNQCNDMHGSVSGGTPICSSATDAERKLLMQQGDAMVKKLIDGIKASPVWSSGRNVIVLVWDENDYTNSANKVVFLTETNYGPNGAFSTAFYDHFSLLRTLEAGFGLSCLNHACDNTSVVMNDLFGWNTQLNYSARP
jgi:phosphatidylinositol-3-phosphatase